MNKIGGVPVSLKQVLLNNSYTVEYYQREYSWKRKQIEDLIEDLTAEFLASYTCGDPREAVKDYGVYFMGSIVISQHGNAIIDGQQRLSSLTLLLIWLKNQLRELGLSCPVVGQLIFSENYGIKAFNINVPERRACMEALFSEISFNDSEACESASNLVRRYDDIAEIMPQSGITRENILHFCDWLAEKLTFILITAEDDQDANRVFVSMNDRGLSLTSLEMLKGFLLSEIKSTADRDEYNNRWNRTVQKLKNLGKKEDENFIRAWLRAQHAETIRVTNKNSKNMDFDLIGGGAYHNWIRDNRKELGLENQEGVQLFLDRMNWFADRYIEIKGYEAVFSEEMPFAYYNSALDFTWQGQLMLAPLTCKDSADTVKEKFNLVSRFIDLYIVSRVVNYSSVKYSNIKNYVFNLTKAIRGKSVNELKTVLFQYYTDMNFSLEKALPSFGWNNYTKKYIKHFLSRILDFLERGSDMASGFENYIRKGGGSNQFEIEHILSDHSSRFEQDFTDPEDFRFWRNNIGALLLLPKSVNASLKDLDYEEKLPTYCSVKGNILSASLGDELLKHNPRLRKFAQENNLNLKPCSSFGKEEIMERNSLYQKIMALIWNTDIFKIDGKLPEVSPEKPRRRSMDLCSKCGLVPGDVIAFEQNPAVTAVVADGKNVRCGDEVMSLSALASKLTRKKPRNCKTLRCFTFNGIRLEKLQRRFR